MFQVKDALEEGLDKSLENPTKFTKKFLGYYKAKASRLVAGVFIKDKQAEYLYIQIFGGVRLPSNKSILTPAKSTATKLNKHGNLTKGKKKRLFAQVNAKTGKKTSFFIGKPQGSTLPYGLYKSAKRKSGAKLSMQLGFYKSLKYKKQFHFYKIALKAAEKNIQKNFNRYMKEEG
ncbi:hypothetical protein MJH12_18955, partial [bacterium]|nr:hypothetical protein [bacterium]